MLPKTLGCYDLLARIDYVCGGTDGWSFGRENFSDWWNKFSATTSGHEDPSTGEKTACAPCSMLMSVCLLYSGPYTQFILCSLNAFRLHSPKESFHLPVKNNQRNHSSHWNGKHNQLTLERRKMDPATAWQVFLKIKFWPFQHGSSKMREKSI